MIRTITTVEELDVLPVGSVIRTSGHDVFEPRVAVKTDRFPSVSYWNLADGESTDLCSDELDDLPATVLFEPEAR